MVMLNLSGDHVLMIKTYLDHCSCRRYTGSHVIVQRGLLHVASDNVIFLSHDSLESLFGKRHLAPVEERHCQVGGRLRRVLWVVRLQL